MLGEQTMNESFGEKKGYDINVFGIVDEDPNVYGTQYNYVRGDGAKNGSNQVASMLYHFLSYVCLLLGKATELHLHNDFCTGQNKNNIVSGYLMLCIAPEFQDRIVSIFMTVGHTKFRPGQGLGVIRQQFAVHVDVICLLGMKNAV